MNELTTDYGATSGENNSNSETKCFKHLQKLFMEFISTKDLLTDNVREFQLYNMLPLFCKLFESCQASDLHFPDISFFCQHLSKLMVTEIKRRGSNQSTETASMKIVAFLEFDENNEHSNGWLLLTAVNIMANGDRSLIEVMTNASIPSTLVKCLYLFFDLPEITDCQVEKQVKFTRHEKRLMLQKVFVQVLVRLCSHPYPAEELARVDDLSLLFSANTSNCPPYNVIWRKSAAEILTTLSRHGLTNFVVSYLHSKGCMSLCIDNMRRSSQLLPIEVVEMLVSVFCFLKDSSAVSQVLLDDFKSCQGYLFLVDFLIKLVQEGQELPETEAAVRNLVLMTASLCICGYNELNVKINNISLFQMQGFKMPQISNRGTCVRNLHAFQVLQTVFLKTESPSLGCIILDAISSVYHSDNANYFILESQNTLCQFSEIIHLKSIPVREKFFGLLEFIVFQLNFVPCKELISLSLLLKSNHSIECSILCMKTLLNLLKHNNLFCDVYREVGILEVFVNCLKKYKVFLEKYNSNETDQLNVSDKDNFVLGDLVIEALTLLLNGNNNNATVFRSSGGSKCAQDMIRFESCHSAVLKIVKEMIINTGGDEEMLRLVEIMQNAPFSEIQLKINILRSLVTCLRDSHRTRTMFRKVNGFISLIKALEALEGSLTENTEHSKLQQHMLLVYIICQVLTTAMRFEPANARYFDQELCSNTFFDAIKQLGCFGSTSVRKDESFCNMENIKTMNESFNQLFMQDFSETSFPIVEPISLSCICVIYRILYNVALDSFDNSAIIIPGLSNSSTISKENIDNVGIWTDSSVTPNSTQSSYYNEPIVHQGVVLCMLLLLQSVECKENPESGIALQFYLAEILKSLVRSERNQQIMCSAGMAGVLLKVYKLPLIEEQHALHLPLQYIFERLAGQTLLPKEFREFLRLGCSTEGINENLQITNLIPLTRIKTLVSMTTPRDFRAHGSYTLPPFVEIDMHSEGFGCIFIPSLAPQAPVNTNSSIEMGTQVIGGIGTADRCFPPSIGLSYSTWFCIEKFSDPRVDPHCLRLFTLVRTISKPREENYVCFSILLSAKDKAIITSTQEIPLEQKNADWEPNYLEDYTVRVWCPGMLTEGQWHHLVVTLNKAVAKNNSMSVFIDGNHVHTERIQYISTHPAKSSNSASSVFAYIGTPPIWRNYSKLCWKQGVAHIVEDVFTHNTVSRIHALGPHYLGSLQAPYTDMVQDDSVSPLVPEERVLFGMNARAISELTLSKIRKIYSKIDCKAIAKQLGMNSHDNVTPIKILHNSAGHLAGAARTLGGVMIGYLGIRCFSPNPVSAIIYTVGGCSVLLGIIAMSQNVESLYAGVKALTCVIKSNKSIQSEMDRKRYYQTLGMIYKKNKSLLNSHILHLTFNLVGTVNSGQETSAIPNIMSFQRQLKYKVATSFDSKKYHDNIQNIPKVLSLQTEQESVPLSIVENSDRNIKNKIHNTVQRYDGEDDDQELLSPPDNQTLLRLLEEKEKISHIFRCARIQGLDTFEGLLLFGKEHCYVIDGFTLLKNREIGDIDSLPLGSYEPILPSPGSTRVSHEMRQSSKFVYEDIREVHKRRYLLQPIALEVFSGDGRNFLLSFPRKVRNKVYQKLISVATSISNDAQQSVAGQSRTANVEQSSSIFSSLIGETSVTQRWVRDEISNFQYLMHLNTLAGRSYNDLMQYPVFPWILADYDSEKLDLCNPKSFRDFSKPMGAQSKERLEQFEKRYKEWDDPHSETPPYYYGTHYSSAMIVCSYLVRLEPFTQHFLRLQGGHFDLADRMFHSIKEAWHSASRHNMADVKELLPEFFYLPEFLLNSNNFDFGMKQNGEVLNDVVLPTWAKNDPREFIRIHREALECDYVSQNLHLWIDLIFGYKQRGHAAVEAANVFHHLFYEGNVDIYNIDDPLKKNATIGFINNFGQIPKQLFRKAHPAKRINKYQSLDSNYTATSNCLGDKLFFHNLENLKPSQLPVKEVKGPVGHMIQVEKSVLAVEQNKILIPPSFNRYIAWGYADHSIRIGIYDSDRALFVCENVAPDSGEILVCACPSPKTVIMAGTNSILTVCDIDYKHKLLHVRHTLHGHTDAVTSLSTSVAFNIIVSGSKDKSAIIWDMSRYKYVRQLTNHVGVVAAVCINELSGDIATCSATWLYVWSINGDCLAMVNTSVGSADRMQQILCVTFSSKKEWDSDNVITTGSTDGVVRMWSLDHVQIPTNVQSGSNRHEEAQPVDCIIADNSISSLKSGSVVKTPSEIIAQKVSEQDQIDQSPGESKVDSPNSGDEVEIDKCESTVRYQSLKNNTHDVKQTFCWNRQLIFRSKLTMHTAYDRKDNTEPASITSLAISNDHRTVFVGDARGRIFSWNTADQPGKVVTNNWIRDGSSDHCVGCHVRYSRYERRNICRNCGQEFCSKCCYFESAIFQLRIRMPGRVCKTCYSQLKDI
ncbi:WD repeat and FYVE domain-containing protein 3 isoform X3 [Toxorhynchites rutilus septentrionalis]|uniref:WD repeat and FYVE domain-containing protein 3 isoform X3 n=1 Tax=Toxorhynchites rutilus septentrionalis TaxID=329112 RepID=UPI002479A6B7|nr:WD repeat and FYVE domain-containing protein 3 isoform X3 [Toxorhynchites rutilus septentrionalis]